MVVLVITNLIHFLMSELRPEPRPSRGLGSWWPGAQAWVFRSLSCEKPGLSRCFQAEPGLHITRRCWSQGWYIGNYLPCIITQIQSFILPSNTNITLHYNNLWYVRRGNCSPARLCVGRVFEFRKSLAQIATVSNLFVRVRCGKIVRIDKNLRVMCLSE